MKLLVAEDHEKLAQSIADGLREEGYSVDLTLNGDEAAGMLAGTRYDCVILDIMLPGREGQVVSRADVTERLYHSEQELPSNVVDVYIGYLRNKIDKPFATKLIHTRRGQGYMLAAKEGGK